MEMLEEGQNQHKIGPKRIKFEEVEEKGEVDRLSALPDCLLVEILSRLPLTEYAFSTCILSKRWKHLWTLTPTLIFRYRGSCFPRFEFYSFVDKALTQRPQSKLKKLQVNTGYHIQYESQVNNWIRYAISCNVEELILKLYTDFECHLDQFLYISSCLTDLTLQGCILNPIVAISWKNLRSLSISYAKLDEDLIENILCGSPLLETLELGDCYGYRLLNITSKSLKKLVFSGYYDPEDQCDDLCDIIEIIAPNILSLTIRDTVLLWKLLLVNVSSLVEAELDYEKRGHYETTRKEAQEEMLKGFIINLVHVKELKIGNWCKMVLSRLEAKGFVSPSNVKFPDDSYDWSDSDSD